MSHSSIPRFSERRPVRAKPQRRSTAIMIILCVMLALYIGFIGYKLSTQDTYVELQASTETAELAIEDTTEVNQISTKPE